jgi:tRNA dimethylallyltransferase
MEKPLIVIVGETASGKSQLAMELARQFNGEIISADSWMVYKGFDIGTAKPSPADQTAIKHYLLDVANPANGYSAVEFKRQAIDAITKVNSHGKLPILVGGTGLYIDSILFDYKFLPPGESKERQELNNLTLDQLKARIKNQGIDTTGIDTRNKRRLIRLLEVEGKRPTKSELRPHTLILGLKIPKDELEKRIITRVDAMLTAELEREVRELTNVYDWEIEPMKGIGYREWRLYFAGEQDLAKTRERIIRSSLQLAKKQRTWFKRNKSIHWLQNPQQAFPLVQNFLSK